MAKVASTSISVFPTLNRTVPTVFGKSQRLLTESNLANLIAKNTSRNFVICKSFVTDENNSPVEVIEFILGGYYISVSTADLQTIAVLRNQNVYAVLDIANGVLSGDSGGENSVYNGVSFDTTKPESGTYLKIRNSDGEIPAESLLMYDGEKVDASTINSSELQIIDGGTI